MLPSPLMSPYSFSVFAVEPLAIPVGGTMPVAKPPSTAIEMGEPATTVCERVKQAVSVVADGMAVTANVSDESPSKVVNHSPTNIPVVEVTVTVTGTAQGL